MNLVTQQKELSIPENKLKKLNVFLENFDIEVQGDLVVLKTSKNLAIVSENNVAIITPGVIIQKSKTIHLNPFIKIKGLLKGLISKANMEDKLNGNI